MVRTLLKLICTVPESGCQVLESPLLMAIYTFSIYLEMSSLPSLLLLASMFSEPHPLPGTSCCCALSKAASPLVKIPLRAYKNFHLSPPVDRHSHLLWIWSGTGLEILEPQMKKGHGEEG